MKPLLEIAIDDVAGLECAERAGIARVELCSALGLGGLTPSASLLELAAQSSIDLAVMIRPRAGGFEYSRSEIAQMRAEIATVNKLGVQAVVFGVLNSNQTLNRETLTTLIAEAGEMDTVCHRAFDLCIDLDEALETAIELGFARILTSGGQPSVSEGFDKICALEKQAAGRIEIMPGGGLTPAHIAAFRNKSSISAFHCSASSTVEEAGDLSRLHIASTRNVTSFDAIRSYQEVIA